MEFHRPAGDEPQRNESLRGGDGERDTGVEWRRAIQRNRGLVVPVGPLWGGRCRFVVRAVFGRRRDSHRAGPVRRRRKALRGNGPERNRLPGRQDRHQALEGHHAELVPPPGGTEGFSGQQEAVRDHVQGRKRVRTRTRNRRGLVEFWLRRDQASGRKQLRKPGVLCRIRSIGRRKHHVFRSRGRSDHSSDAGVSKKQLRVGERRRTVEIETSHGYDRLRRRYQGTAGIRQGQEQRDIRKHTER
mmetsp:Transcript_9446/g.21643  ORF Transcript_9446/g.21643 Transcript_9446/m.21643 type:complete len:244 (+) Transcript_9446:58-789(+)